MSCPLSVCVAGFFAECIAIRYDLKTRACGGSAANTIIGASYFGANVFYTCNVADDEGGEFYVEDIRAAGVDTNMGSERDHGITGKCLVMVTPDAERTMNTFLGITGELSEDQVDEAALSQSEYVYIEGYLVTSDCCRAAAVRVRDLARKHGVKVAMTFSDPAMVEYFMVRSASGVTITRHLPVMPWSRSLPMLVSTPAARMSST